MIKITNLTKTFQMPQPLPILKGIDLEIIRGELLCIVGASGVGKSTFLHLLGGLDRPTAGTVEFEGQDLFALTDNQLAVFRLPLLNYSSFNSINNLGFTEHRDRHLKRHAIFLSLQNQLIPRLKDKKGIAAGR